jgi:hypothetical protein
VSEDTVETRIPARMDRLPWSSWHWLVVLGLGSETFPLEIRAMAIALFYAISTGIGGARRRPARVRQAARRSGPDGRRRRLLDRRRADGRGRGDRDRLRRRREQQSLEEIAEPLSAQGAGA